jgi:hypothetical protein
VNPSFPDAEDEVVVVANRVRHSAFDGALTIDALEQTEQIASFRFRHAET